VSIFTLGLLFISFSVLIVPLSTLRDLSITHFLPHTCPDMGTVCAPYQVGSLGLLAATIEPNVSFHLY